MIIRNESNPQRFLSDTLNKLVNEAKDRSDPGDPNVVAAVDLTRSGWKPAVTLHLSREEALVLEGALMSVVDLAVEAKGKAPPDSFTNRLLAELSRLRKERG